jgi:hypothetical protein
MGANGAPCRTPSLNQFEDTLRKNSLHLRRVRSTDIRSKRRGFEEDCVACKQVSHRRTMPEMNRKIEWRNDGRRPARTPPHHCWIRAVGNVLIREESVGIGESEVELGNDSSQLETGFAKRLADLHGNQSSEILLLRLQAITAKGKNGFPVVKAQSSPFSKRSLGPLDRPLHVSCRNFGHLDGKVTGTSHTPDCGIGSHVTSFSRKGQLFGRIVTSLSCA